MGGSVDTSKTTEKGANPAVNTLLTSLAKGASSLYSPGASAYVAPSATTRDSWDASLDAASNPDYSSGIAGAMSSYAKRAAGAELGLDDPLYAQQRSRLTNDVLTSVNGSYNNSGMFGSDQNQGAAARGLAEALGGLDLTQRNESYGRQAEAVDAMSKLFSAGQAPASVAAAVGSAQDADAAANASGQIDYLGKYAGLVGSLSGSAGTTATTSTPLWQVLASLATKAL